MTKIVETELTIFQVNIGSVINPVTQDVEGFGAVGSDKDFLSGLVEMADNHGRDIAFK